jgi:O-antigen/teichoic acid export membrane protein
MQDQGIIFIIAYFFTSHVVGFYSFVIRIVNLPVGLIGASMFQVFYQKASTLYNNNQSIRPTVVKLYIRSFLIGLPIFGVLFFFAPQIFSIVFSEKWRYSGEIAQIIAPWIFLNFISSPISSLPLITNNQKIAMYFVIVDFFFRIVALTIGGFLGSFKIGITIMTVTCSMVLICALYWYYKLSGKVNKSDIIESHSEK